MPTALTENEANADFSTGLAVPTNGDDSVDWFPLLIAGSQQLADRSQRLRLWIADAPELRVPLSLGLDNGGAQWEITQLGEGDFIVEQSSVASAGSFRFPLGDLPVGRKITAVSAYWQNASNTTLPLGTAPKVRLIKKSLTVGAVFGTGALIDEQADTTAVAADYQKSHLITLSGLTETIAADAEYYIEMQGETGSNAIAGGRLGGLRVTLGI